MHTTKVEKSKTKSFGSFIKHIACTEYKPAISICLGVPNKMKYEEKIIQSKHYLHLLKQNCSLVITIFGLSFSIADHQQNHK